MKLTYTQTFRAGRERVYESLIDPAVLRKCIDGCERLEKVSADGYEAHLKIGVGIIRGSYKGSVRITNEKPPESFTLTIEGKGAPGFVRGTAIIQLAEVASGSEIVAEADAAVGGLIAAVGSRLIESLGKRMMAEFFRRFAEEIDHAGA